MNLRQTLAALCGVFMTYLCYGQEQIIAVETDSTGLYFAVTKKGNLYQQYLGPKLKTPQNILLDYDNNNQNTKNVEGEAYSAYGNGNVNETALKASHADGNLTTVLKYAGHWSKEDTPGVQLTQIQLKDEAYPFTVNLYYKAYKKENVIETWAVIRHQEKGPVKLEGAASGYLFFKNGQFWLTHFYGAWSGEMKMVEDLLSNGIKIIDSKKGVRTTQSENPSFILSLNQKANEDNGEVVIGSLAWSNNYKLTFQVDNLNNLHILAGINDYLSDYWLQPNTDFITPTFIFTYSPAGVGQASRNMHRWARNYGIQDGNTIRPIVLNSWEGAYFNFDEKLIKNMIDDAASMGVEMFVLDDGWFGNKYPRNNDKAGLGDWQVNKKKLPGGIKALVDHANKKGLKFGIWVEPEMVQLKSELAEKHPDWIVTRPNREYLFWRNQLLLDLSNPDVQDFVYHAVADLLEENPGIAYVKWDANRHVENLGSSYLDPDKQSHFWIEYGRGLYSIYQKLTTNFPNVIFQACSSGGGRVDYGALKYHHEFWASDNTDALSRIFINWGFSQIFPAIATASHVSSTPNHQTKHVTPIKFRFDVSMAQRLGLELQPKLLTPEELDWTQKAVAEYKKIREIVQLGDQYRLISPYSDKQQAALMYVNPERSKAVVFAYVLGYHYREDYPILKLKGLDPDKNYRIREILPAYKKNTKNPNAEPKTISAFAGDGKIFSGDFLMKYGMRILLRYTYQSAVFSLEETEN